MGENDAFVAIATRSDPHTLDLAMGCDKVAYLGALFPLKIQIQRIEG